MRTANISVTYGRPSLQWFRGCLGLLQILLLTLFLFGRSEALDLAAKLPLRPSGPAAHAAPQQLSRDGRDLLRALVEAGEFPELRWPDFSDYREDVVKFYEAYGFALPWVREMQPTRQARDVIALLRRADEKGLSADDYDGPRWSERLAKLKPTAPQSSQSDGVRFDVALTVSVMRYISDLHVGKINPEHLHFQVHVAERRYNLSEFLKEDVVDASDVPGILEQVEPAYPGYQRTIYALQTYQWLAREDDGEVLPATEKPVMPGDFYPGVPRLTRFLRLVGDLPVDTAVTSGGTIYHGALVEAVRNFQQRHGLNPDGRIDARTLAELNVPLSRRVRQMQLTLERWRWMPSDYQQSPIVVNIPEFRLRAYDDQFRIAVTMSVVVGQAYSHNTPVFISKMRYVVFRPYWEVPPSIAEHEIIPAIQRDPGYVADENLEFVDSDGNAVSPGSVTPDMLQQVCEAKLFIRQKPGPKNSLGLIKFMFPNEYDVYMHDTPATELFTKSRRDFSHGCIRLEKPAELAAWVLRDNPGWTIERIHAAMNGDKTEQVNLARPIRVFIVYGTVIVLEDGVAHFYDDIYGHDAALDQALGKGYPYPR